MQESNNKLKLLKKILKIVIMIFLTIIVTEIVYNITLPDDTEIEKSYNEKKEKFQLLEDVANCTIEEGIGICTQNIPSDKIKYNIYTKKDNFVYYYYISDEETKYNAKITLSSDYEILDEEYSVTIQSFEEFSKVGLKNYKILVLIWVSIAIIIINIAIKNS